LHQRDAQAGGGRSYLSQPHVVGLCREQPPICLIHSIIPAESMCCSPGRQIAMTKPPAPPTLIYDHSSDPEDQLWDRLNARAQPGPEMRLIVHLKTGSTVVGRLRYYDNFHLTVATEGQLRDILYRDVAHILEARETM